MRVAMHVEPETVRECMDAAQESLGSILQYVVRTRDGPTGSPGTPGRAVGGPLRGGYYRRELGDHVGTL